MGLKIKIGNRFAVPSLNEHCVDKLLSILPHDVFIVIDCDAKIVEMVTFNEKFETFAYNQEFRIL